MFSKILACLDGSELAEQILPYAVEEASKFESELVLLRVVGMHITIPTGAIGYIFPPTAAEGYTEMQLQEIKREDEEAVGYLNGKADSIKKNGVNVTVATIQGKAGEAIVNYAVQNSVELIALATHGRTGLGRAVFGSVADFVLRESGLPILVIKPQ
jgi:nucleotide-binding universal stress UspA family protein